VVGGDAGRVGAVIVEVLELEAGVVLIPAGHPSQPEEGQLAWAAITLS